MAWPQAPQPAPAPTSPGAGAGLPLGALVTAGAAFLTFLFSFVQIVKADSDFVDIGWSVWTTQPGFFGVGTWIPLFALIAGAAALARSFVPTLADKQVAGFGLLQVQLATTAAAVLLWLGYMVSILLSDDTAFGLGAFLLFLGLAGVVAGTVLGVMDLKKGTTSSIRSSQGPPSGQWPAPGTPAPSGQWPQPTPPPPGAGAQPHQWSPGQPAPGGYPGTPAPGQYPGTPAPGAPAPGGYPGAPAPGGPAAPGQWQPDPSAPPPPSWNPPPGAGPQASWSAPAASDPGGPAPYPAPAPAPPGPSPEPGPLDPQPAPPIDPGPGPAPAPAGGGGGLFDPGTEVIPGPPPAPPAADHVGGGPDARPPLPPSNTP